MGYTLGQIGLPIAYSINTTVYTCIKTQVMIMAILTASSNNHEGPRRPQAIECANCASSIWIWRSTSQASLRGDEPRADLSSGIPALSCLRQGICFLRHASRPPLVRRNRDGKPLVCLFLVADAVRRRVRGAGEAVWSDSADQRRICLLGRLPGAYKMSRRETYDPESTTLNGISSQRNRRTCQKLKTSSCKPTTSI